MRGVALWFAGALLAGACVVPAYEVDPNFGAAGSAGSAGSSSAGTAGSAAGTGGSGSPAGYEEACIMYCGIYVKACEGHEANTYDDTNDCVGVCAGANWAFDPNGDLMASQSLQCRLTHAQFARDMGRDPHCYHSSEFPTQGACE